MLKQKLLEIPQKAYKVFPNGLCSLAAGSNGAEQDEGKERTDKRFESGEELETFQPNGLGIHREFDNQNKGVREMSDGDFVEIRAAANKGENRKEVLAMGMGIDDKRWDLDYELLLGYLPTSRDLWEEELAESRLKYAKLKGEFLLIPVIWCIRSEISRTKDEAVENNEHHAKSYTGGSLVRQEVSNEDHPLCLEKASVWHRFFEFAEISEQIDRDLERTHPTIKFFSGYSAPSKKNKESMKNVLLLFAKLNPEIRYVQGMNEILAPLYYVFSRDFDEKICENVEADSFYCFVRLMSDLVDHFCEQLDNSSVGIRSSLLRLSELLKANDEELWMHLELTNKVNPQFYGFRWITLLITQEFNFQTILRIWDSLLSNPLGIQEMLLRVCCAMLLSVKTRLLSGDFVDNLKLLQHYPEINIECILKTAQDITPVTSSFHVSQ